MDAVPADAADPLKAGPVVLVTSASCTACARAKPVVEEISAEFGLTPLEARVEDFPELGPRHAAEIPVLAVDGVPRDFWVIDPVRFRRLLSEPRG